MADTNKFEEMLEHLVNNDRAKAEELFHEIVVAKSRDIYENILTDDVNDEEVDEASKDDDDETNEATDEEVDESDDEEVDEASKDDDDETNENFNLDEFEVEGEPEMDMDMDADMGGDAGDKMAMDMGDEGDSDEPATKGDIMDLEAELEDLKAEFEDMLGDKDGDEDDMGDEDEEGEEGDADMDMDADAEEESYNFEANDEEVDEASDDEEVEEVAKSAGEQMREYVEKVSATMGDNGANAKSVVAGKNDMGGTASNLVKGGEADTKGTTGGLAANSTKEDNAGNVNVPGGKASKSMSNMPKGHGAEKKGAGDTAPDKKSMIGS